MDASLDDFDLEGDYEAAGSRSQVGEPYMPHQVRICGKLGNLGNVQDGVITIECDEWQPLPDAPECHASHERQLQHHLQRAFDSSDARLQTYAKDSRHDHVRVSDFYGSNTGPILNEFVEYGLRDRDLRCDLGSGETGESGVQLVREASQHSLAILGNAGLAAEDRMGEAEVGGLGAVLDGVFWIEGRAGGARLVAGRPVSITSDGQADSGHNAGSSHALSCSATPKQQALENEGQEGES